jgi:hypothetical protein
MYIQGRILNRFTKDIAIIDDTLPWTLIDFLQVCYKDCRYAHAFAYLCSVFFKYSV